MQFEKSEAFSAEQLLKFVESRLGVWVAFAISGVAWAVWFLTMVVLSPSGNHFPVWFWVFLPFGAVMAIALSGFILMVACVATLSIWVNTRGRSYFFRFAAAFLVLFAVLLILGFQYVNQD